MNPDDEVGEPAETEWTVGDIYRDPDYVAGSHPMDHWRCDVALR